MIWAFFGIVAVGFVGVVAAVLTSRLRLDPMAAPVHTAPDPGLGETPSAADVDHVRFDTALRGYRMDQVDAVLDRLRARLAEVEADNAHRRTAVADAATGEPAAGAQPGPDAAHAPAESE